MKSPHTIRRSFSASELSAIAFTITLLVAAIAICLRVQEPAIWTFLGTAIATAATRMGSTRSGADD